MIIAMMRMYPMMTTRMNKFDNKEEITGLIPINKMSSTLNKMTKSTILLAEEHKENVPCYSTMS